VTDRPAPQPDDFEELRNTVAIARGRVDAMLAGRGGPVVWQRLAEDLDSIAAALGSPSVAPPDSPRDGDLQAARGRLLTMAAAMVRGTGVCERPHRNGEAHPHVHFDDAYIGRGRELSNIARSLGSPSVVEGLDPDVLTRAMERAIPEFAEMREGESSDWIAALSEGIHKAMCFSPTTLHNRLACQRGQVYWNIAEVALGHPAMREVIDVQRRSTEAAFGALSAVGDDLDRALAAAPAPDSGTEERLRAALDVETLTRAMERAMAAVDDEWTIPEFAEITATEYERILARSGGSVDEEDR
jgi:hypothetical protein